MSVGSLISGNAAGQSGNIMGEGFNNANNTLKEYLEKANAGYSPYLDAGKNALSNLGSDYFTHQFDQNDLANGLSPNYQFQLQQGQGANRAMANAGGGAIGGNALKGLQDYTQNFAGNAYQQAFTNYQNQRSNIFQGQNALAGMGLNAAGGMSNNFMGTGQGIAGNQIGAAQAQAAAQQAKANGFGNFINSGIGMGMSMMPTSWFPGAK
jgi:di/tricarboxylate transporter